MVNGEPVLFKGTTTASYFWDDGSGVNGDTGAPASGEPMQKGLAASPSWPMGTKGYVIHNGKLAEFFIGDRGPGAPSSDGVMLDLDGKTFAKLTGGSWDDDSLTVQDAGGVGHIPVQYVITRWGSGPGKKGAPMPFSTGAYGVSGDPAPPPLCSAKAAAAAAAAASPPPAAGPQTATASAGKPAPADLAGAAAADHPGAAAGAGNAPETAVAGSAKQSMEAQGVGGAVNSGPVNSASVHSETGHGETGHGETGHGEAAHAEAGRGGSGHGWAAPGFVSVSATGPQGDQGLPVPVLSAAIVACALAVGGAKALRRRGPGHGTCEQVRTEPAG
ncbi:hypothetical protein [Microbispora sp. NPDC049125]|uniref:hypothetical protein n=1 Tax=Microbispora sp. NPDC049125 TaxID=3154929 RepID=UPI003464EE3C